MIHSLTLQNFKPFKKQFIQFQSLTVLSGLNSTGKSSTLQSLLLLRQSYQQDLLVEKGLALNGDLVCIGTAKDALFENAEEDVISFTISGKNGIKNMWNFNYNMKSDVLELTSSENNSEIYKLNLFTSNFYYLQAERIGPRTYSKKSDFQVRTHKQIGTSGEYTAHFLAIYRDQSIPNIELCHPLAESSELGFQVEAWMGEVSPGTRIKINDNPQLDLMNLQYSYGLSNVYRATNVGFGISYVLPILVAVLASEPGTLILIENPEAHLHPKGQSQMGQLLALAASCGVQIVIETHSDHVLNGIRLAVHSGKLKPQDVQLHFFQKDQQGQIEVISPKIDKNGRINQWPAGFFDQTQKDLIQLM
ncbi:MAG TPA: DUF3696 domain-containing protein [Candidatus Obscuribacterales bacterium]